MTEQSEPPHATATSQSLLARWLALTLWQQLIVAAAITGFVLLNVSNFYWQRNVNQDILRQHFHLPQAVEFSHFQSNNKPRRLRIAATVQFSQEQFRKYVATLNDASIWQPVPLRYDGTIITGTYSSKALRWSNIVPIFAGEKRVHRRNFSYIEPSAAQNLQYFCLAIQKFPEVNLANTAKETEFYYVASACSQLSRQEKTVVIMEGTLDYKKYTLQMTIT